MAEGGVISKTPAPAAGSPLARVLGPTDAAAIMISNMIGVGILTLPGIVALSFGSLPAALAAWALGGALSLAGALVHSELGCRHPLAGGDYVFLREAFGRLAAFFSGWTSFTVGFPGAIAAASLAAAATLLEAAGIEATLRLQLDLALGILIALTAIHATGLRWGKRLQNLLVILELVVLFGLATAGLLLGEPATGSDAPRPADAPPAATAALIVFFAYCGWNSAAYVAGEIREPRRNLPRALIGGVLVVTALYLIVNLAYFRVVPIEKMGENINIGGEVARRISGDRGARLLSLAISFIFLGSASAMTVTGPRITYAMARDGLFPRFLSAVGASSRAPARAIWLQGLVAAALLGLGAILTREGQGISGTFEKIVSLMTFAILPFAALTAGSVFILRRRDRLEGRSPPFRAPGHPWVAIAFIAAALALEGAFLAASPENRWNALAGSLIVLAGTPVYLWGISRRNNLPGAR